MGTAMSDTLYTKTVPATGEVPPSVETTTTLDGDEERTLMADLEHELQKALSARTTWMSRQTRFFKKRFGIYPKKLFPWPGSASYHLPLIEKSIRKFKPTFVSLLADVVPTASFMSLSPELMAAEPFVEREFHWLLWQRMDIFESVLTATDYMLARGFCVGKVFYERRTSTRTDRWTGEELPIDVVLSVNTGDETPIRQWAAMIGIPPDAIEDVTAQVFDQLRDAKQTITVTYQVVEYDAPRLVIRKPEDVVVPSDTTTLQDARFIFDLSLKSGKDLRQWAKEGWYRKDVVEALLEHGGTSAGETTLDPTSSDLRSTEETKTGLDLWQSAEDLYRIVEAYCFFDVNGDGEDERVVLVYAPDYMQEPLAVYLYQRSRWPFQKIFFEQIGPSHVDHRGHAELLDPLQTVLKAQHDQKIDRQTITTALSFKYVPGGMHPGNVKYIPGQGIAVRSMAEFEFITPPNTDFAFDKEMLMMKAWAEETVGNPDYGLAGPLSSAGSEARTAREIQAIAQEKQQILSLDAKVYLHCWQKLFEMIWEEWVDYGPRQFVVRLMGEPPIPVDRTGMVMGEFQITPTGNLWNSNPQANLQKAMGRLQLFLGNPFVNQYALLQDAFLRDDPRLVSRLLIPPEQAQHVQKQMQEQAFTKGEASQTKQPNVATGV